MGIRIGHRTTKTTVMAHVYDVIFFNRIIGYFVLTYERTKGVRLNICRTKAMAACSWNKSMNIFESPYYQEITVLGFRFTRTVARSWETGNAKALKTDTYGRDLYLKQ